MASTTGRKAGTLGTSTGVYTMRTTQQLSNGIRLTTTTGPSALAQWQRPTATAPAARPPRVAPPARIATDRLDPQRLEHYALALSNPALPSTALEPWHAVVLVDRVSKRGDVLVYLTDGDWRCEVPSRVLEQVLEGTPKLVELHGHYGAKRTVRLHVAGA